MKYQVYIKSHTNAPDYEEEFTDKELKPRKCLIPWADDVDEEGHALSTKCGGKLIKTKDGFKCKSCGETYYAQD